MSSQESGLNRRTLARLAAIGTGGLALSGLGASLGGSVALGATAGNAKIADAATKCLTVGELCAAHCVEMLGAGQKDMAACLASVRETLAACEALRKLAATGSARLKAFAAVCADICADCAKACEPHVKMAECKACQDACKECEKACRAA